MYVEKTNKTDHLDVAQQKMQKLGEREGGGQKVGAHVRTPPKFISFEPTEKNFIGYFDSYSIDLNIMTT